MSRVHPIKFGQFYKNSIFGQLYKNSIFGQSYKNSIFGQFYKNSIFGQFYKNSIFGQFNGHTTPVKVGSRHPWLCRSQILALGIFFPALCRKYYTKLSWKKSHGYSL